MGIFLLLLLEGFTAVTVVDRQWLMWLILQRGQVNTIPEAASAPQPWFNRSTHRLPPTTGIFQQNTSLAGTDRDNIAQLRWWLKSPANVWSCCVLDKVTRVTSLALSCAFPSVHEKMKCYPRWETHNIFQHKGKDRKHRDNNSSYMKEINNSRNYIQALNATDLFFG